MSKVLRALRSSHPFRRFDADRNGRVGFMSGILIAILASGTILGVSHFAGASPFSSTSNDSPAAMNERFGDIDGPDEPRPAATAPASKPSVPTTPAPAVTPTGEKTKYAVLGDSVAAGLGLPIAANANTQDRSCGRSSQSYGYEVGRQLGYPTMLLACSGATAGDLVTQQRISGNNPQAQISAAYAGGAPQLISITAGANDIKWETFIRKCYAGTCGTSTDTNVSDAAIVLMRGKLTAALENIRLRAIAGGTQPLKVVVTGYYDPVSPRCATTGTFGNRITATEAAWLSGRVSKLNDAIQRTASPYGFVTFAPVDFTGHDLCSDSPWIQGLADSAPIHPTADGQRAIAEAVVRAAR